MAESVLAISLVLPALLLLWPGSTAAHAQGADDPPVDPREVEINQTLATFVSVVDPFTNMVALAAGVAAMVAFATDQGTSAVGVTISVTTIPAAAYLGVMLAGGFYDEAAGGLKVLIVNILCVMLAQVVTLVFIRLWRRRRLRGQLTGN